MMRERFVTFLMIGLALFTFAATARAGEMIILQSTTSTHNAGLYGKYFAAIYRGNR